MFETNFRTHRFSTSPSILLLNHWFCNISKVMLLKHLTVDISQNNLCINNWFYNISETNCENHWFCNTSKHNAIENIGFTIFRNTSVAKTIGSTTFPKTCCWNQWFCLKGLTVDISKSNAAIIDCFTPPKQKGC